MRTAADELDMMEHPDKWPLSFVLPVKRSWQTYPGEATGFLYQPSMRTPCPPPKPIVYLGNIFDSGLPSTIEKLPSIDYESIQAIIEDGWEVD